MQRYGKVDKSRQHFMLERFITMASPSGLAAVKDNILGNHDYEPRTLDGEFSHFRNRNNHKPNVDRRLAVRSERLVQANSHYAADQKCYDF